MKLISLPQRLLLQTDFLNFGLEQKSYVLHKKKQREIMYPEKKYLKIIQIGIKLLWEESKLTHLKPIFPSYRNPSVDLGGVSINMQSSSVNDSNIVQEVASFVCS